MIGIKLSGKGIGDTIQFASFPENHYRNTGEKVVDVDSKWVFDHNPYVVRDAEAEAVFDLWELGSQYYRRSKWRRHFLPTRCVFSDRSVSRPPKHFLPSIAERTCAFFGHRTYLRHPRFYIHEDIQPRSNQVCVHLDGKTTGPAPENVVERIRENYAGYDLVQIGGPEDTPRPGFRSEIGLPLFESCRIIAESLTFIGVNSAMMNAAMAYPRVNKRIIILASDGPDLEALVPMNLRNPHHHWLDHSLIMFNESEDDKGVTYSYRKK